VISEECRACLGEDKEGQRRVLCASCKPRKVNAKRNAADLWERNNVAVSHASTFSRIHLETKQSHHAVT